jgi:multiple sugar transport system substrate-binding protein
MNKKPICAILLIATLLAACKSLAPPTPVDERSVKTDTVVERTQDSDTITLRFAIYSWLQGQYDGLIQAFEAANPDVRIKTVSIEQTLGDDAKAATLPADAFVWLASAADVIALPANRDAVLQNALLELTPYIESDPNIAPEDFYPTLLQGVQWDGGIWSLPTGANYNMLNYNKELFDAAGVAYPQPGWTWGDFLAAAKALSIRQGDKVAQWGFVQPTFDPIAFIQSRAGLLFDSEAQPPTAKLNSPAVAEAVQWYADLFLLHQVAPYPSPQEGDGSWVKSDEVTQLVENGQAAMWFGEVYFKSRKLQQVSAIVPFPVGDPDDATTPVSVDGLSISRGTNKADLAWQWVSFLAQQQVNVTRKSISGNTTVPALPAAAAASGFWDQVDDESAAALHFAIDHAYVDKYDGVGYGVFSSAVMGVIENGWPVERALAGAQVQAEDQIETAVSTAPTPVPNLAVAEEEEAAINAGAVVIQFGLGDDKFGQQSFQNLAAQFLEERPDIIVELEQPNLRGGPSLESLAAEYDCFQSMPSFNSDDAVSSHDGHGVSAILNMEPFFVSDSDLSAEDFYALDQFTYQGRVWGIPGNITVNVMNYNKHLFDAAGLDYPSAAWTTSDFMHLATTLTQGEGDNKQYGYLPFDEEVNDLMTMVDRLGGDMLDDSVEPPRVVLNSPNVLEAVRWYTGLPDFSPSVDGPRLTGEERYALIAQGRVAMWIDPWGKLESKDLNVGVAPLPLGPNSAEGSGYKSVDGFFISAEADARQACWSWIAFLTGQPNVGFGLPARRDVAASAAYRQAVGAERADAYIASVSSGSRASFVQRLSDDKAWIRFAYGWLSNAYERIIAGDMTVDEAMNTAQEAADVYYDCAITNNALQPVDWEALGVCFEEANAAVPDLAGDD